MLKRFEFLSTGIFWIYVLKCLAGLSVCYAANEALPGYKLYWSMISVLLVLSPDHLESRKLPVDRIKANVIGSCVGLVCFILPAGAFFSMSAGVVATIIICTVLNLGAATRSALAALVIVLVQQFSEGQNASAFERMASVIFGCFVALLVSIAFEFVCKKFGLLEESRPESDQAE